MGPRPDEPPEYAIDLGHDHFVTFTVWEPDRALNPQYRDVPDVDPWGAIIWHRDPSTGIWCTGGVTFNGPVQRQLDPDRPKWTLVSLEPLHVEPSVLCRWPHGDGTECGDHGFIRHGRWEPCP